MKNNKLYVVRRDNDADFVELFTTPEAVIDWMVNFMEEDGFFFAGEAKAEMVEHIKAEEKRRFSEYVFDPELFFTEDEFARFPFTVQIRKVNG